MLETPFGKINILVDGVAIHYMLAIGVEDENPAFELERLENGMEYRMNSRVEEVVFGIAWTTDYKGTDDVRVWFAADPTVYFKTEM